MGNHKNGAGCLTEFRDPIFTTALIREIQGPDQSRACLLDLRKLAGFDSKISRIMSENELQTSKGITTEKGRRRYCLRKGLTRIILGDFLNVAPHQVQYGYDERGKPFLPKGGPGRWEFSLSHSGDYLCLGIGPNNPLGVDVEQINLQRNVGGIAASVFSPEEWRIYRNYTPPEQLLFFYRTWIQKEAIGKALGLGLASGFTGFSVVEVPPHVAEGEYELSVASLKSRFRLKLMAEWDCVWALASRVGK